MLSEGLHKYNHFIQDDSVFDTTCMPFDSYNSFWPVLRRAETNAIL